MVRIARNFLRLQWLALGVALLPAASQAAVCNGQLTILQNGPNFAVDGSIYHIQLNLAPSTLANSVPGNQLTINRVKFELDCTAFDIPCPDAGPIVAYQGDSTLTTDCATISPSISFSSSTGASANEIVFTPSPALVLTQTPLQSCNIFFDIKVLTIAGQSVIKETTGFELTTNDAVCNLASPPLASGSQQTANIPTCNGGVVCDDNNVCTTDTCDQTTGQCVFTAIPPCNDNNACTTDTCNPATGCVFTPITCNDNSACTIDSCNPATGCVFTPITCNDANACTTDTCNPASGCVFTPIAACNDNNACTTDTCNPATGCVFTPIAACDDGNACTTDTCNPATGCVFTPITCNDNSACTTDTCNPATGCVFTPLTCNDNNVCTTDTCNPSTGCVFNPIVCNDNNPCTDDTCDTTSGCVFTQNPSLCPPIPVVPSPASPAGLALIGGLAVSIGWMLNRLRRSRLPR